MKRILNEIVYDAKFIKGHTLQPGWYKILKAVLLMAAVGSGYFIFGSQKTLAYAGTFFGLSLIVHLVYRKKTERFTKSWLDFIVTEVDGLQQYERIGLYYYLAVGVNLIIAYLVSWLLVG